MSSGVLDLNVNSSGEETLEDLLGPRSSCLMHSSVTMHVDVKRTHVLLE
jgi:hypothetical protein